MWDTILAFAIMLFCGGQYVFADQLGLETNPLFLLTRGSFFLFALGYALYTNVPLLIGLIKMPQFTKTSTAKVEVKSDVLEDVEFKDFESLTHLRNRCVAAGSEEGVKVCADLAAIMFKLNTPVKKVE